MTKKHFSFDILFNIVAEFFQYFIIQYCISSVFCTKHPLITSPIQLHRVIKYSIVIEAKVGN